MIRACRDMGIPTVAVYSDVDRSQHVLANEAYEIGPAPSVDSYLREDKISPSLNAGADAIHPGYGFLSERYFVKAVEDAGITIGPSPKNIEDMGDKLPPSRLCASGCAHRSRFQCSENQ